ncbi:MAG: VOC family protein [Reichenbachiella sp.]|uniref:VOC family protein n=1 Tax=Reichenbachiella sp. TaxID=2184521 RepID=UPI0032654C2E
MKLGAFSVSLNVKDIHASKTFYENLGFKVFAGDIKRNYLIMKNQGTLIGLFQGMFDGNMMTFNPGWDQEANTLDSFDDIRAIQKHMKAQDLSPLQETDESSAGPASLMVEDPDGNKIFIDQHV